MGARVYLASIGRFTSQDRIPGGNANAYVYSLDPINLSDYTGNSSGPCAIACFSGAQVSAMFPSSNSTQYLQPTISGSQLVSLPPSTHINIPPARAAAKPAAKHYDNSTALPAATINSLPLATPFSGLKSKPLYPAPTGVPGPSLLPAAGYSLSGFTSAVAKGCVATGAVWGGIGAFAAPFTEGASVVAGAVDGCLNGMAGGLITYALTGDTNWQDSSAAGDAQEYLFRVLYK